MYDQAEYPQTSCACGEHYCVDCANNTDGNPMNCPEFECFAGAVCRFKERGDENRK